MSGSASDDELARTATALPSAAGAAPAPELGATLGRYRLEKALGEGAMGVVHAAFDPDLERRVALKVLRTLDGGGDARQRLLREARALARLTHANVVTVHEVGSADGRDYVAMELVDGETVAQWLRDEPRSARDVIAVFVAAGRGLAAAHAAGLVHRDFKPHNVLRRRDGRIVVTDFGLARGVEMVDAPRDVRSKSAERSSLSGLTMTGSVLGTPAYMAPEQWSGGVVGPAADQFAFCVALWEALVGERPFRGDTVEQLRAEIERGSATLDPSKLPRHLRRALVRGLAAEPEKRWPTMDALLAQLVRAERRPGIALALGSAALALGVVALLVARRGGSDCEPPALPPASVWSEAKAAALSRAEQAPAVAQIAADFARWGDARAQACRADPPARVDKLACLDGVLARIDAVTRAIEAAHDAPRIDPGIMLVDPAVCSAAHTPRLITGLTPERLAIVTAQLEAGVSPIPLPLARANELVKRAGNDPCASAVAHVMAAQVERTTPERQRHLAEAEGAAQQCGDDRLIADVAFFAASQAVGRYEPDTIAKLRRAEADADRVAQADLRARLDQLRAELAQRNSHIDEAFSRLSAAAEEYASRGRVREQLRAELALENLRQLRAHPDDLAAVSQHLAEWRALAVARLGAADEIVRDIDQAAADWQFARGDVAGAHAALLALHRELPLQHAIRVTGRVLDEHGVPVAGARVTAAESLTVDSLGIMPTSSQRSATTGSDGSFVLAEAAADGVIVAEVGDRRSAPAMVGADVTLGLEPTSRLEGKIDLRGEPPTNVMAIVRAPGSAAPTEFNMIAPIAADGTFWIDHVPRGQLMLHAQIRRATTPVTTGTEITVTEPVVRGIQLAVAESKRAVHVIVRSTVGLALFSAQVVVMPGHVASTNAAELNRVVRDLQVRNATPIEGEHAPAAVIAAAKPGDVYATFLEAPEGVSSACAIGLPTEITDPDLDRKVMQHLDKIEVRCEPIDEHAQVVVVEVPPWPRFD